MRGQLPSTLAPIIVTSFPPSPHSATTSLRPAPRALCKTSIANEFEADERLARDPQRLCILPVPLDVLVPLQVVEAEGVHEAILAHVPKLALPRHQETHVVMRLGSVEVYDGGVRVRRMVRLGIEALQDHESWRQWTVNLRGTGVPRVPNLAISRL
jgi:hypothetical protein